MICLHRLVSFRLPALGGRFRFSDVGETLISFGLASVAGYRVGYWMGWVLSPSKGCATDVVDVKSKTVAG